MSVSTATPMGQEKDKRPAQPNKYVALYGAITLASKTNRNLLLVEQGFNFIIFNASKQFHKIIFNLNLCTWLENYHVIL